MRFVEGIEIKSNVFLCMRERGKLVPGSKREGHNVFTITGRNILSKLIAWQTVGSTDVPFTHRRVRWMGVGIGSQLEVTNVIALNSAVLVSGTDYLAEVQSAEFPTSTSVRIIKVFGPTEITFGSAPVAVTEAGLFADVNPWDMGGTEDSQASGGFNTTLRPDIPSNPPITYKTFEPLNKTSDFSLEIQWDFRF
jgi:hypothetical protein